MTDVTLGAPEQFIGDIQNDANWFVLHRKRLATKQKNRLLSAKAWVDGNPLGAAAIAEHPEAVRHFLEQGFDPLGGVDEREALRYRWKRAGSHLGDFIPAAEVIQTECEDCARRLWEDAAQRHEAKTFDIAIRLVVYDAALHGRESMLWALNDVVGESVMKDAVKRLQLSLIHI